MDAINSLSNIKLSGQPYNDTYFSICECNFGSIFNVVITSNPDKTLCLFLDLINSISFEVSFKISYEILCIATFACKAVKLL